MTDARRETPDRLAFDKTTQRLAITWHDGHASAYTAAYLRYLCPCAGCRGHVPGEVEPPTWDQVKEVTVRHAAQVGGYALQFAFSDGHDTGIYAYDKLRAACPCEVCRSAA